MLEQIKGIKLKGANFTNHTELNLFDSPSNQVTKVALVYGRNGSGKSTISNAFREVKGEDISNIEYASLYDNHSNEITISKPEDKMIFVFNEDFVNDKVKIKKDGLDSIIMLGEMADLTVKMKKAKKELSKVIDDHEVVKGKLKEYTDKKNIKSPFLYEEKMYQTLRSDDGWAGRERKIKDNRRNPNVQKDKYLEFVNINVTKSKSELLVDFEELLL